MNDSNYAVVMSAYEQAEFMSVETCEDPDSEEIVGETVISLISPGTELSKFYSGEPPFPKFPGYAAIMKVLSVGDQVKNIMPGDYVFGMGTHRRYQKLLASWTSPLPNELDPSVAVIARLLGVSMTTLVTTKARPGEHVLIMGAGPVGFLAAHLFKQFGYRVSVCEPDLERRHVLISTGISSVFENINGENPVYLGKFSLVLECSGHEGAALNACNMVRKSGEVVLVGVPWKRRTDLSAHEILHTVFRNYVHLRSGWEWEIPTLPTELSPHSILGNYRTAMEWLQEGKFPLDGLIRKFSPKESPEVYRNLADRKIKELFVEFDWSL